MPTPEGATEEIALHDRVRLIHAVPGVPVGSTGAVVLTYGDGAFAVELDDPGATSNTDGIVDVAAADVERL